MKKTSTYIALGTLLFLALALFGVYWAIRQTPAGQLSSSVPTPLSTFKDLFLVVATGIIALCSAYLGAYFQTNLQLQQKKREEKRENTKPYKDYLLWTMQLGQLARIVKNEQAVRDVLPQNGKKYEITPEILDKVISNMPLWWNYSSLAEGKAKDTVFAAMYASIEDLMKMYSGVDSDAKCVEEKYLAALAALEEYER
jgi:hypothetical protein